MNLGKLKINYLFKKDKQKNKIHSEGFEPPAFGLEGHCSSN